MVFYSQKISTRKPEPVEGGGKGDGGDEVNCTKHHPSTHHQNPVPIIEITLHSLIIVVVVVVKGRNWSLF